MLPQEVLSTQAITAAFRAPRDRHKQPLVDFELGGAALNDASAGLEVKVWRGRYAGQDIVLDAQGVSPFTLVTVPDITEFQFTFDQNMQPFIAYVVDGASAFYRWFDGTVPGFVTTEMAAGVRSPRCSLDDKRQLAGTSTGASDIILAYIRDDALYFRAQRDRYETEYALAAGDLAGYQLGQVGLNRALRFQFQFVARRDPTSP